MPAALATISAGPSPALRQQGVAAVEFAIVVFILLLIGAGMVEFGRALWYYDALVKGTRDAARYLSTATTASMGTASVSNCGVSGKTAVDCAKDVVVQAATAARVPGFAVGNVSVTCTPTACAAAAKATDITRVSVSASFPMTLGSLFPFVSSSGPGTIGSGSIGVTLTPHTTMSYMW